MGDIPSWVIALIALFGSPVGAFVGVRIAMAKHEIRIAILEKEMDRTRGRLDDFADHINRNALSLERISQHIRPSSGR